MGIAIHGTIKPRTLRDLKIQQSIAVQAQCALCLHRTSNHGLNHPCSARKRGSLTKGDTESPVVDRHLLTVQFCTSIVHPLLHFRSVRLPSSAPNFLCDFWCVCPIIELNNGLTMKHRPLSDLHAARSTWNSNNVEKRRTSINNRTHPQWALFHIAYLPTGRGLARPPFARICAQQQTTHSSSPLNSPLKEEYYE